MADDTNKDRSYAGGFTESGFDASIPVWDGKADSLREFRRMTTWWLHSINLERTKEFNLAARFAMKQKGAAKLRALEFTPEELAYIPAETAQDPDTDETLVITPAKYDAGIQKILDAWDQMVGRSLNDKKGELREKFYLHAEESSRSGDDLCSAVPEPHERDEAGGHHHRRCGGGLVLQAEAGFE